MQINAVQALPTYLLSMIEIGKHQQLQINRQTAHGLYLGDSEGEEVLLPKKYCPEDWKKGEALNVFVYRDHEERKVATRQRPKVQLYEFALLQVTDVSEVGAFMDWGLEKELLVPFREQRQRMEKGRWYVVFLDVDGETDRLYASNRLEQFISNDFLTVQEGQEVEVLILKKTDLGFSVIVNHLHEGMVFDNEVFQKLDIGQKTKGYIKYIREDNKLDVSLQPIGYRQANSQNAEKVYRALEDAEGFLPYHDKSDPEAIYKAFGISKKAFKKAIGELYKARKIDIMDKGITQL